VAPKNTVPIVSTTMPAITEGGGRLKASTAQPVKPPIVMVFGCFSVADSVPRRAAQFDR